MGFVDGSDAPDGVWQQMVQLDVYSALHALHGIHFCSTEWSERVML
jgi:hypothetical protein